MTSSRILALLELADECPSEDELAGFLNDPDPDVRRTALSVLSEATEDWTISSPIFARALDDTDESVREQAVDLLGELREVLVAGPEFAQALRDAAAHPEAVIRVAAIGALWRHRLCLVPELSRWLRDPEPQVRGEVVLGLVSLDALDLLGQAATDTSSAVRLAAARGIAAVGDPRGTATLIALAGDPELLVRAAALSGMSQTGCSTEAALIAQAALGESAWQVRQGAANALSAADPGESAHALIGAANDDNLDVRKAAIKALGSWLPARPELRAVLEAAQNDLDADVRAYARMSLHPNP
ncbi:MAG TPA: HEAT repeat domain-containing protein [Sporichthyaceae bacterium]|jgi:HEAT repeat protein|nr:HEAT repeat domain-containing protein [Sporichthyaceae bacterium]